MALSIIGTPAAVAATTITLPTHAVGDIIVIVAFVNSTTLPTKPTAGGTVPTWTDIDAPAGANSCSMRSAYAVATAANHTSGTWTTASALAAIVIRGQAASPIGGHAQSGSMTALKVTAPAITMTDTSGASILLEFHSLDGTGTPTLSAAPTGYTRRASVTALNIMLCINTKDVTTSDGAVDQPFTGSTAVGEWGATIEILAAAAARLPRPVLIGQAVNRAANF